MRGFELPARGITPSSGLEVTVRALLIAVGVVAVVLILLGLLIKAIKWLIIIGLIALVASIVLGVVKARRAVR
jgi:hypothetical protein